MSTIKIVEHIYGVCQCTRCYVQLPISSPLVQRQSADFQHSDNTYLANEVCPCTSQFIWTSIVLLTVEAYEPT